MIQACHEPPTATHGIRPRCTELRRRLDPAAFAAAGLEASRARLGVAVFQTDVARYASSYGLSLTTNAAWRWIRTVHSKADLTLAPASAAIGDLENLGDALLDHYRQVLTARVRQPA